MKDYSKYFVKPSLQEEAKRCKERVVINKDGLALDDLSKNGKGVKFSRFLTKKKIIPRIQNKPIKRQLFCFSILLEEQNFKSHNIFTSYIQKLGNKQD